MADPVLARVGVPVMFMPRPQDPHSAPRTLRQECRLFVGSIERVVSIAGIIDSRYPNQVEAALFHVDPERLLFGSSWIACGDVLVMLDQTHALAKGGAHE